MAANVDLVPHASILDENLPYLVSNINIRSGLWDHMISQGVIRFDNVENIKVGHIHI